MAVLRRIPRPDLHEKRVENEDTQHPHLSVRPNSPTPLDGVLDIPLNVNLN